MGVGDGLCPQEKALKARWMESSREVNTKMEKISGISTRGEWGQKRPTRAAGRTESEDMGCAAVLTSFPWEARTGVCTGSAQPSPGLWGNGVLPAAGAETLTGFLGIGFKSPTEGLLFLN